MYNNLWYACVCVQVFKIWREGGELDMEGGGREGREGKGS